MMLSLGLPLITILLILCSICIGKLRRRGSSEARLSLPPGPKPLPLLGNLLDIPLDHGWETITKWGELYGQFFSMLIVR